MSVGKICTRVVATAHGGENIRVAAERMDAQNVGTLVVITKDRRPEGILTDRDVTLRCVARGRDPDETPVSEVMTRPLRTVRVNTPIEDALESMRKGGVRRLVVVDQDESLVGLLALNDVVDLLVEEVETIGGILRREVPFLRS